MSWAANDRYRKALWLEHRHRDTLHAGQVAARVEKLRCAVCGDRVVKIVNREPLCSQCDDSGR